MSAACIDRGLVAEHPHQIALVVNSTGAAPRCIRTIHGCESLRDRDSSAR